MCHSWERWPIYSILTVILVVCATSCNAPERDTSQDLTPSTGKLRLLLTDSPIADNVEAVTVTISRVDIVFADDSMPPETIVPPNTSFNLLDLRDGVTAVLGVAELPVGLISQLRLIIEDASITIDGQTSPLKIPSGEQTGEKLVGEFEISPCFVTTVTIDFDAEKSIRLPPGLEKGQGEKYLLQPVLSVVSVESDHDTTPPQITILEDRLITVHDSLSFHVSFHEEKTIDLDSFTAALEGENVSEWFVVTQQEAESSQLVLPNEGVNELSVSVLDICGNLGEATAYVFRGEAGELPEVLDVIGPEGGEVAVTDPSSSLFGVSVIVPPGALDSAQAISIGLSQAWCGRPDGLVAVGPAVEFGFDGSFSQDVTVTLPYSEKLVEFFRGLSQEVEVWKHEPIGWSNVGSEIVPTLGVVQVNINSFSQLQAWMDYPDNLLIKTIAGGGEREIPPVQFGYGLADNILISSPTQVSWKEEVIAFNEGGRLFGEFQGTRVNSIRNGLIENEAYSSCGSDYCDFYTAVALHEEPDGLDWLYYAVDHCFDLDPGGLVYRRCYGMIRRKLLGIPHDELVAGKELGSPEDGVVAADALLGRILGLEVDEDSTIYYAEMQPARYIHPLARGHRVRKVDPDTGEVLTIAGTGIAGFNGDEGIATATWLSFPQDANIDSISRNGMLLFVADTENHKVRAINISDDPDPNDPTDDPIAHLGSIDIGPGEMKTIINLGEPEDLGEDCSAPFPVGAKGPDVHLFRPRGLALAENYLFVSDACHRVLIMSLDDLTVTEIAGVPGVSGFNSDGMIGRDAKLDHPMGLHFDEARQELLIADWWNDRIRSIDYRWRIYLRPDGCDSADDPGCEEVNPPFDGSSAKPIRTLRRAHGLITEVKVESQTPPPDDDIDVVIAPGTYYGRGYHIHDSKKDPREVDWTYTMPDHSIKFMAADPNDPPRFVGCNRDHACFEREYEMICRWCEQNIEFCISCEQNPTDVDCFICFDYCPCDTDYRNENLNRCHCNQGDRRRAGIWFLLTSMKGENTNIHFENIIVTEYQDAIDFHGSSGDYTKWNGSNRVVGCQFLNLGDGLVDDFENPDPEKRGKPRFGYNGIKIANSRNNVIAYNYFYDLVDVRNIYEGGDGRTGIYMHGVYLAWYSHWNNILHNVFKLVSGDPIKVRDFSNFNSFTDNLFSQAGYYAAYAAHFCNFTRGTCFKTPDEGEEYPRECPSYQNLFAGNILDGSYEDGCQSRLPRDILWPLPSSGYLEACCNSPNNPWSPDPCEPPVLWVRAIFDGNVHTGQPCSCLGSDIKTVDECRELLGL